MYYLCFINRCFFSMVVTILQSLLDLFAVVAQKQQNVTTTDNGNGKAWQSLAPCSRCPLLGCCVLWLLWQVGVNEVRGGWNLSFLPSCVSQLYDSTSSVDVCCKHALFAKRMAQSLSWLLSGGLVSSNTLALIRTRRPWLLHL